MDQELIYANNTLFHVQLCSTLLCHHVNFHPKHAIFLTPQPRLYIPSMLEFLKKKFSTLINVQYQVSIEFANFEKKLIAACCCLPRFPRKHSIKIIYIGRYFIYTHQYKVLELKISRFQAKLFGILVLNGTFKKRSFFPSLKKWSIHDEADRRLDCKLSALYTQWGSSRKKYLKSAPPN